MDGAKTGRLHLTSQLRVKTLSTSVMHSSGHDSLMKCVHAAEVQELERLEHEHHADPPEPATAAFMAASALRGKRHHVATDATMRTLGLDICAGALPYCYAL